MPSITNQSSYRFAGLIAALAFWGMFFVSPEAQDARADEAARNRQYVQVSVVGKYSAARNSITAAGKPKHAAAEFAIDFGKSPQLADEAAALDGKTVTVRGSLAQCSKEEAKGKPKCDPERSRTGMFLQPVSLKEYKPKSGAPSSKDHGVSVVCRGLIHTDVVALRGRDDRRDDRNHFRRLADLGTGSGRPRAGNRQKSRRSSCRRQRCIRSSNRHRHP